MAIELALSDLVGGDSLEGVATFEDNVENAPASEVSVSEIVAPDTAAVEAPAEPESAAAQPADESQSAPEAEQETAPPELPKEITDLFPNAEDIPAQISAVLAERDTLKEKLANETASVDKMVNILTEHPRLLALIQALDAGSNEVDALRKVFQIEEEIPEPNDPRYREFVKKQIELEEKEKRRLADQEADSKVKAAARDAAMAQRAEFQKARNLPDDKMSAFLTKVKHYVYGDPETGMMPTDFLETMWKALNYENDIESARKKGEVAGRNDAIDKLVAKKPVRGDGIPAVRGTAAKAVKNVDALTPLETALTQRKSIFDI